MGILKMKLSKRRERGIALIFTLIMLSLLLILALGFALNSMFDQKAASNSANASFAAFLAQTQLKQIMSLIKNNEVNLESSKFYSHDSGSPDVTDPNMLKDMLSERLAVPDLLPKTEIDTNKVNWSYVRSQDLEKRIIGRTAFVVIANGIPLGSLLDGRAVSATLSASCPYPKHNEKDDTETRIGKYVSEINVRAAVPNTVEIAAHTVAEVNSMTNALNWQENTTLPLPRTGFANGKYSGIWADFSILFEVIEGALSTTFTDPQKKEFRDNLSIIPAKDKEAFWADINDDTVIDSNELYKRFDLTRTDWSNPTTSALDLAFIKDKILLTTGTVPDIDMQRFNETDSDSNSKGLPWLACFGYKDDVANPGNWIPDESLKGTFGNILARRMQIAANLKDYCDSDKDSGGNSINRPTSDVDPATWVTTTGSVSPNDWKIGAGAPTFTGNERTPYINKVGFSVSVIRTESPAPAPTPFSVGVDITISPYIELINIYGNNWSENLTVNIRGSLEITTTVNGIDKITSISDAFTSHSALEDGTIAIDTGDWNLGYSNFMPLITLPYAGSTTSHSVGTAGQAITVKVTDINITEIVLHYKGVGYDYAKILRTTPLNPILTVNDATLTTAWFGFAVHDPRQNLNSGDWKELTPLVTNEPRTVFSLLAGGPPYLGAPNSENSTTGGSGSDTEAPNIKETNPAATVDLETGITNPADGALSTAFIRNAPMESPWELGFIHRGAKWETINLKTYDSLKAYKTIGIGTASNIKTYLAGGGAYASGDANILDQIKMTAKAQSPQKINLKSQKTTTFDALFSEVKLGCVIDSVMSINSMATGGSPPVTKVLLTAVSYTGMRANIMNMFKTVGTANRTRSSIAGQLALPVGATTDAAKEELIGKIINLTKVNGKVGSFTIVILAQMIKDIGGPVGSPVNITKYSNDTLISSSQGCEVGVFNADINDINDSKKNIYYDEITAEQKILVKAYRTIDGNIKITSFQYLD